MQLRFATKHTSDQYVRQKGWLEASIRRCPRHPRGGCGWARHGTYQRKHPAGAYVVRWYCKKAHQTFSLLPDCLASRLPSTLPEVEDAVVPMEAPASAETKVANLRTDLTLPAVLRWVRRRERGVRAALTALIGLFPERLAGTVPTLTAFRERLGQNPVLPALRELAAGHLRWLPPPLGFGPRAKPRPKRSGAIQHKAGPDPPAPKR